MEKLKDMKVKHNHTLTDILKVLIFSLVMLAPFGAVLSKCLYTTFNKNAKDSYSGNYEITYKYESNQVANENDLVEGNIYQLNTNNSSISEFLDEDKWLYFELLSELDLQDSINVDETLTDIKQFSNSTIMSFYKTIEDNTQINLYSSMYDLTWNDYYISFVYNGFFDSNITIKLIDKSNSAFLDINYIQYTDYNEIESVNLTGTLDNGFYYAVNELSDQPLFNWTKNTFIYSTINQMTTGLDFGNNNVLALLLTYWILNTLIYIIFDIIIEVFKKLTHMFN